MSNLSLKFVTKDVVKTMPLTCLVLKELASEFGIPQYAFGLSIKGKELSDLYICGYENVKYRDLKPVFDFIKLIIPKTSDEFSDTINIHLVSEPYWNMSNVSDINLIDLFIPYEDVSLRTTKQLKQYITKANSVCKKEPLNQQLVNLYSLLCYKYCNIKCNGAKYYCSPTQVLNRIPEAYVEAFQLLRTMFYATTYGDSKQLLDFDVSKYKEELNLLANIVEVELCWE